MNHVKKKYLRLFFIAILASLTVLALIVVMFVNNLAKNVVKNKEPITINLLTSVHPSLPWKFKALDTKIIVADPWFRGEENKDFIKDNWIRINNV